MKRLFPVLLLIFLFMPACAAAPTAAPEPILVQYTFAARPWLADVSDCAGGNTIHADLRAADYLDLSLADMAIRIGDAGVASPAYQIDTDELLVVVNPRNSVTALTAEEVLGLFTGRIANWQIVLGSDAPVQVWTFAAGEDVQQTFEQTALGGAPVVSAARLAAGPDEMAQAIAGDMNAVGILTRRWKMDNVSAVHTVASLPVLVLTSAEPTELTANIVTCLQK